MLSKMNFKLFILSVTIFSMSPSVGQSLRIDTLKTKPIYEGSIVRWQCHAGSSIISEKNSPLIIINGKKFENCLLQNIFFDLDTAELLSLRVISPQNDSIKIYGKSGRNGVIVIEMIKTIKWISAKQILAQKLSEIFGARGKTLIIVDNVFFDPLEQLYFQEDLIENINVENNTKEYFDNRQFDSVVKISLRKNIRS